MIHETADYLVASGWPRTGLRMPTSLDHVRNAIRDRSCASLCLDIFDTILWRRVPRPTDVFSLLGADLRRQGRCPEWVTDATFRHMRISAEIESRHREHGPEVSLYDIWREMPLSVFDATLEELVDAEISMEFQFLVVDHAIAELIELATDAGVPIVLVSDTYFTEDQLRYFLERPELAVLKDARLFRSHAYGVDKANGLWPVVLKELRLRPEQVWHVGDNFHADVLPTSALGVRATHYERIDGRLASIMSREKQPLDGYGPVDPLLDAEHGDFGLTSLRAKVVYREPEGLARAVSTAWRYGATVLGPALAGFAEWVVERAEETGTSVVWCPMREGELLAAMVNEAARARGAAVEARPLWLSRHVTSVAMLDRVDRGTLSELIRRSYHLTVGGLLDILHLRPGDVPALAGELSTVLETSELLDRVAHALTESPHLLNQMTATVTSARERLITALKHAGALESENLTLVDLGWGGTIQYQLANVLQLARLPITVSGLYLATEDRAARVYRLGLRAEGYLAQAGQPAEVATTLARSPEVIEQAVNALCGSLIDFTSEGEPIQGPVVDTPAQNAERRAVQDGVHAFQGLWSDYVESNPTWPSLAHPSAARRLATIVVSALKTPTSEEAQVFGNWRHEDNFGSTVVTTVIPEDLAAALAYLSPNDLDDLQLRDAFWPRLIAATDPRLAAQVDALQQGQVDREVFEPSGEPFETHLRWRGRSGHVHPGPRRRVRINHNGLSFARLNITADDISDVALSIPGRPAIVRIDWIEARVITDRAQPHVVRWDSPEDVAQLVLHQCRWLGGTLVEFDWPHSAVWLPLADAVGGPVSSAQISVAFAMLPRSASGLEPHLQSASTLLRLAHRAAVDYQQRGVVGLAVGLKRAGARRLARDRRS
ncbi:HAD family hydrolase [Geodermatophilus sp. FMUSA9-8]|uniref:HAD family hydrolase n=1 Tax=Geodermatophilus sp. FMUSA9-8 TaxID=3120155 RepID=UPI00300B9454